MHSKPLSHGAFEGGKQKAKKSKKTKKSKKSPEKKSSGSLPAGAKKAIHQLAKLV